MRSEAAGPAPADVPSDAADPPDRPPGDPETVARIIVLRALDRSAKTRTELATTLARRGVPDEAAEKVLDRFTEVGLIDDAAFADMFATSQHHDRGLARRAVAEKLRRRGVDEETARGALDTIDGESELATARALVARKLTSMQHLERQAQARRLVGLLARKGYSSGLAYRVVREQFDELDENAEVDE